jgi:membrane-bound lytic murein transglycosylase B
MPEDTLSDAVDFDDGKVDLGGHILEPVQTCSSTAN